MGTPVDRERNCRGRGGNSEGLGAEGPQPLLDSLSPLREPAWDGERVSSRRRSLGCASGGFARTGVRRGAPCAVRAWRASSACLTCPEPIQRVVAARVVLYTPDTGSAGSEDGLLPRRSRNHIRSGSPDHAGGRAERVFGGPQASSRWCLPSETRDHQRDCAPVTLGGVPRATAAQAS